MPPPRLQLTGLKLHRWPGPVLRRVLGLAAGHPLFATELLRAYAEAGALTDRGPDTIEARTELGPEASGLDQVIFRPPADVSDDQGSASLTAEARGCVTDRNPRWDVSFGAGSGSGRVG